MRGDDGYARFVYRLLGTGLLYWHVVHLIISSRLEEPLCGDVD